MILALDASLKTPSNTELPVNRYVKNQAVVGFVIARMLYCLCPLTGALLGAATAGSHILRENISEQYQFSSEIQKTAILATCFFASIFCIQLLTAPPISYLRGLLIMTYVHNMGEETIEKLSDLKDKILEKAKEYWPKKPIQLS